MFDEEREPKRVHLLVSATHQEASLGPLQEALDKFVNRLPTLGFSDVAVQVDDLSVPDEPTGPSAAEPPTLGHMVRDLLARLEEASEEEQREVAESLRQSLHAPVTEEQRAYSFAKPGLFPSVSHTFGEKRDPETGELIDAGVRIVRANPSQRVTLPVVKTAEPECPIAPGMHELEDGRYGMYLFAGRGLSPITPSPEGIVFTEGQMASWPEDKRFPPINRPVPGESEE